MTLSPRKYREFRVHTGSPQSHDDAGLASEMLRCGWRVTDETYQCWAHGTAAQGSTYEPARSVRQENSMLESPTDGGVVGALLDCAHAVGCAAWLRRREQARCDCCARAWRVCARGA